MVRSDTVPSFGPKTETKHLELNKNHDQHMEMSNPTLQQSKRATIAVVTSWLDLQSLDSTDGEAGPGDQCHRRSPFPSFVDPL